MNGDLISRSALFKEFERIAWYNNADRDEIAEEVLLQMPAVDAVEVVRCKYCKHSIDDGWICGGPDLMCMPSHPSYPDNFCSYRERKDNEL